MTLLRRTPFPVAVCLALRLLLPPGLAASRLELVSRAEPSLLADSGGGASAVGCLSSDGRFTVFTA